MRTLVLSPGDSGGIGVEILLKAAKRFQSAPRGASCNVLVSCDAEFLREEAERFSVSVSIRRLASLSQDLDHLEPGHLHCCGPRPQSQVAEASKQGGDFAWTALDQATQCVQADPSRRALVTAPICKESMAMAGFPYPGHTEFLAAADGKEEMLMLMHSPRYSVGLVSNHVPVADLPAWMTLERFDKKARLMATWLQEAYPAEELKVLGFNPHAGDGGVLGHGEDEMILRGVRALQEEGFKISGPHPADAAMQPKGGRLLAMYHDQGLPVFKFAAGGEGVNVSLGLSFVRVSPDHGTAFDIAGRGQACEDSMYQACCDALDFLITRDSLRD